MNTTFRLNFEQQKKRAKELLKNFKQNQSEAIKRFEKHHPKLIHKELTFGELSANLADSQLVVARELGCNTWTKLKNHITVMDSLRDSIKHKASVIDEPEPCLHVRCGSDIQKTIVDAGFTGDFLEFSDPFCVGPTSYDYQVEERAKFLFSSYGKEMELSYSELLNKTSEAYQSVRESAEKYDHIVLWFEHDSYDQLILIFLLSLYHRFSLPKNLWIVTTNSFPGAVRFRGFGQLPSEAIRLLWKTKQLVSADQCREADQHWRAFTNPNKECFHQYIENLENCSFPYFKSAALRQIQEQPICNNELPLTQKITVELLTVESPQKAGSLFKKITEQEDPLPFLGDLMYWHILRQMRDIGLLKFEGEPELWSNTVVVLK